MHEKVESFDQIKQIKLAGDLIKYEGNLSRSRPSSLKTQCLILKQTIKHITSHQTDITRNGIILYSYSVFKTNPPLLSLCAGTNFIRGILGLVENKYEK